MIHHSTLGLVAPIFPAGPKIPASEMPYHPSNPGKKPAIAANGNIFLRLPVRTRFITIGDDLAQILREYALPQLQSGDLLCISEKVVSLCQRRVIPREDIHPGFWANLLCRFVHRTPAGPGAGTPHKMQLCIMQCTLPRVLLPHSALPSQSPWGSKESFIGFAVIRWGRSMVWLIKISPLPPIITTASSLPQTHRLLLRPFSLDDAPQAFRIFFDPVVNTFLPWYPVETLAETQAFLKERWLPTQQPGPAAMPFTWQKAASSSVIYRSAREKATTWAMDWPGSTGEKDMPPKRPGPCFRWPGRWACLFSPPPTAGKTRPAAG